MDNNPYTAPATDTQLPAESAAKLTPNEILFGFKGRISRSSYWAYSIVTMLAFYAIVFVTSLVFGSESLAASIIALVCYLPVLWITIAIQAKRWHDRDKSAWWVLIAFVPVVGALWAFIENGCLKGTDGPNNFGQDPL
ncbi:DUF805 domain-containing protein [Rubritalea marina]|uniref:DUF805 domain-containing protein n=1 Tax=Rubritalea marina TaxID=361055 RepID=UPI00036BED0D|nr:DUF805 domain-containing protein [Rubritalea marina]